MQSGKGQIDLWIKGIPYEVAFWNNVYRWRHTFQGLINWSNYGKIISLEGYDANARLAELPAPVVLDVGCGMSYATGNFIGTEEKKRPLDIHYVDPLADFYNDILRRFKRRLPRIEFAMAEYLSAFYPPDSADVIIIQNALDHSARPMKSIVESLAVLKKGGVLYLNHHVNEAETEKYKGFHKYNIREENGNLIIWNKACSHNAGEEIADFATFESVERNPETGHVTAVIHKTNDVPARLLSDKNDKRELCEMLIKVTRQDLCGNAMLKKKAVFWTYNAVQFLAQSLPWAVKMKLKQFIKQA